MNKRIIVLSGPLGPKTTGNQSIKNTLLGYLEGGYGVWHFGMVSARDAGHDFSDLRNYRAYRYVGLPAWVMTFLTRMNQAGRSGKQHDLREFERILPQVNQEIDLGDSEITRGQILVARLYAALESLRVLLVALLARPDALYGYEIYGAVPAARVGRLLGIPVFTRYQGTYVTPENFSRGPVHYHFQTMMLPVTGVVMANDGTKGDWVLSRAGVSPEKTLFVTNGLDDSVSGYVPNTGTVAELSSKLRQGADVVLGVFNRLYPFKRIDRAIHMLRAFRDQGANVRLVIGGGGGPMHKTLVKLVDDLGVRDSVTWLGRIHHERMPEYYVACDAVVVVNDYANTGNQVLEAIGLGVPLLATDDGNNSRLFGDCPYAHFFSISAMNVTWNQVVRILAARGTEYRSTSILKWSDRMNRELEWVETRLRSRKRGVN